VLIPAAAAALRAVVVQHVIELAAPALTAWMDAQVRHQQPTAAAAPEAAVFSAAQSARPTTTKTAPHKIMQAGNAQQLVKQRVLGLQGFFEWVKQETLAGDITFEVKRDAT
jgi:hypothetical protein